MSLSSVSLTSGPLPIVIVALGIGSVVAGLRFRDGTWRRQLVIGIPVTAALVGVTALLVDGLALVPYQFPNSYYLWVGFVVLAVVSGVIGWRRFHNWRRAEAALSVLLTTAMALTLINEQYDYYPTVGSVFGVNAANEVSQQQLDDAIRAAHGNRPGHGFTVPFTIPGKVSGFKARDAFVWLPPAWIANPKRPLPVIEMLSGVPGDPADWTRAGLADQTARDFALAHGGVAPILVMPDSLGVDENDTECVNSQRGQAETYLTVDVPAFMASRFAARTTDRSMAIAGLSAGGMCAMMLALRHPDLYAAFGDFSGLTSPTVDDAVAPERTTRDLFKGSRADYDAHDPLHLLATTKYPDLAGWFEVGTADREPLHAQKEVLKLAKTAQLPTCSVEVKDGLHSFAVWAQAFKRSLPWLASRLGLTPEPTDLPVTCT